MDNFVYPTNTCFDDAIEIAEIIFNNSPERRNDLRIVHGIAIAPDGNQFSHAWVTDVKKSVAYFAGILRGERKYFAARIADYETGLNIVECTRYTLDEVIQENKRTRTYGPWIDRYLALCSNRKYILVKQPL